MAHISAAEAAIRPHKLWIATRQRQGDLSRTVRA
jgi:hypothetical protein